MSGFLGGGTFFTLLGKTDDSNMTKKDKKKIPSDIIAFNFELLKSLLLTKLNVNLVSKQKCSGKMPLQVRTVVI